MSYLYGIVGIYSMQPQFFSAFPLAFFFSSSLLVFFSSLLLLFHSLIFMEIDIRLHVSITLLLLFAAINNSTECEEISCYL